MKNEGALISYATMKQLSVPADANASAITGSRIKLEKGFRLCIAVSMGDSTAAVTSFTLRQHDAASAGNSKDLTIELGHYFHKVGSAAAFTKVEFENLAVLAPTVFAADEGIMVMEVLAEDLDVDNDFGYVSCDIADSTASKIFAGSYILHDMREIPAYAVEV